MKLWAVAVVCVLVSLPIWGALRLFKGVTFWGVYEKVASGVGIAFFALVGCWFFGIWAYGALSLINFCVARSLRPLGLEQVYRAWASRVAHLLPTAGDDPGIRAVVLGALAGAVIFVPMLLGLSVVRNWKRRET